MCLETPQQETNLTRPRPVFPMKQHPLGAAAFGSLRSPSLRRTQRVFGGATAGAPPRRALPRGRQRNQITETFLHPRWPLQYCLPIPAFVAAFSAKDFLVSCERRTNKLAAPQRCEQNCEQGCPKQP